jgi:hypothetical protein
VDDVLILGSGEFGRRAVDFLSKSSDRIVVVDKDREALKRLDRQKAEVVHDEAICYLCDNLDRFTWVVPAIPTHVAFEWVLTKAARENIYFEKTDLPHNLDVPNAFWQDGTVYASLANHLCPVDCPEPKGFCFLTGEQREIPLHDLLARLALPGYTTDVIRSHQLAPGVGGLLVTEIKEMYKSIMQHQSHGILATSCSCHAVVNGYCKM